MKDNNDNETKRKKSLKSTITKRNEIKTIEKGKRNELLEAIK